MKPYITLKLEVDIAKALSPENIEGITYLLNSSNEAIVQDYFSFIADKVEDAIISLNLPDVKLIEKQGYIPKPEENANAEVESEHKTLEQPEF